MREFVFLVNVVDVKAPFKAPFYMWRRGYLFRFVILKFIVKKMLFCIKRSFVWSKKIVFDESFCEIVLLLIQFFSCTWLLLFLRAGRLCNVLSDLRLFFIHLMTFFQWFDEIQSRFFSPLFFLWDFLCLFLLEEEGFFPVDL